MKFPWTRTLRKETGVIGSDFYDRATEADIIACFRLLLGRNPNPEERRGHMMRIGEPLVAVLPSYLNSLEFANRALLNVDGSEHMVSTQVQGYTIFSSLKDLSVGKYVRDDNYEQEVTAVFRQLIKPGMRIVDIGANIGYFTLLSAMLTGPSGHVLAVEPNPRNARALEAGRRANGFDHVTIVQAAAGRKLGLLVLNTSHSNGTTSALPNDGSRIFIAETVPSMPLDMLVGGDEVVDFIKVDVEGAEYNALLGGERLIRRCRPVIVTEFSPTMMPGISHIAGVDYLRWLIGLGYGLSVIEPDGSLLEAGKDSARVMAFYEARMTDHIDIVATPF